MEYTIWAIPALCEDPIEITVHSNGDGRKATQECLSAAVMMNTHPTTGQTADEFRAVGRQSSRTFVPNGAKLLGELG